MPPIKQIVPSYQPEELESLADLGWVSIQRHKTTGEVFAFVPKGLHLPLGFVEQIASRLRMHVLIPEGSEALRKFLASELASLSVKLRFATIDDGGNGHPGTPGPGGDGLDHFGLPWNATRALIEEATGNLLEIFAKLHREATGDESKMPPRMLIPRADF